MTEDYRAKEMALKGEAGLEKEAGSDVTQDVIVTVKTEETEDVGQDLDRADLWEKAQEHEIAEESDETGENIEAAQEDEADEEITAQEDEESEDEAGEEKAAQEGEADQENMTREPDTESKNVADSASLASIEPMLDERIVRAVREMGFEKLTPIQVQAIPYLLDGEDIIGQAQTGTGKTAAFAIPALQKIDPDLRKLQTVILCPTRELAMQAAEEIRHIAKYMHGIKVLPVYGGQEISKQIKGLKDVQIIVGTPGRVMDHMRRHTIKLDYVNMVVLDEADEMLDMGFREDMELILGEIPNAHQTALFSATMPQPILEIANQFQKDARLVRVAAKELTIPLVSQRYYRVKSQDKDAACIRLLEYYQPRLCLIFCNTKIKVDELSEVLKKAEFRAEGLHGDMSQHQRDVAMNHFRNGSTNILIATDVAARGIDVDNVEVVINYDLPMDNEYYVHRIGRTGRAGKTGRSFTFVSGRELYRVRQIERFCRTTIEEKTLPDVSKVMRVKAEKFLNRSWELHGNEDIDLMRDYVERKMEEEGCEALDLAAAMLKYQIGDLGPEIEADDYEGRKGRGDRDRGRGGRRRRGRGRDEERDGRGRRERGEESENRRSHDHDEEREDRRSRDRSEEREDRSVREHGEEYESRARREEERQERESRREFAREEDRLDRGGRERGEDRGKFDREENREGRRRDRNERSGERGSRERFEREESREGRRRERDERFGERGSRERFEREESRESRRRERDARFGERGSRGKFDREESRDSRRRDRDERREDRVRFDREDGRDSRRRRGYEEERSHGRFERESDRERRDSRRHDRDADRGNRGRLGREADRDSRGKRDRDAGRFSRLRDVRMEGSERGIAFSFPKKKKK